MNRAAKFEGEVGPEVANPDNWPSVDTEHVDDEGKKRFRRRVQAVRQYLLSSRTLREITNRTGVSKSEIRRLVRRCFTEDDRGQIWGWAALLPNTHIKKYTLKSPSGKAGRWQQFLNQHADIAVKLDSWALARRPADGLVTRGKMFLEVWMAFEQACTSKGIDTEAEYPFSNKDRGREAVRLHCRRVRERNFLSGASAEYGKSGVRSGIRDENAWDRPNIPLSPYRRVQLDGHRLDTLLVVVVEDADGMLHEMTLSRVWLLVLIDVCSRAVLGYHLSLEENYTADDVLQCVASALTPWKPYRLPDERVSYNLGAGLPSGVIPECAWRAFDSIRMDNAWSQTSKWVQERIMRTVSSEVITNLPSSPRSNAVVERFMSTFERSCFHKWPTTTGSNPTDPKRTNPEKQAKLLKVQFEDIQIAADLAVANYNGAPHVGLNGMTPLEFIQQRIDRRYDFIRHVRKKQPDQLELFQRSFTKTVRGGQKQRHAAYVQFMGVRYSSPVLTKSPELIGKKIIFRVNVRDIRTAEVFHHGKPLGPVYSTAKWMQQPHSLRVRRAIMKLTKKKKINAASTNPVAAYLRYLQERQRLSKRERNKLLRTQREVGVPDRDSKTKGCHKRIYRMANPVRIDTTYISE